jgi:hypothetical protein
MEKFKINDEISIDKDTYYDIMERIEDLKDEIFEDELQKKKSRRDTGDFDEDWKPNEIMGVYWTIIDKKVIELGWLNSKRDEARFDNGNIYKSKEQAQIVLDIKYPSIKRDDLIVELDDLGNIVEAREIVENITEVYNKETLDYVVKFLKDGVN